jgi:PleD family two-component response regulator
MSNLKNSIHIYMAVSEHEARSKMEDVLVLDGFDVSTFSTPQDLWDHFQARPARFVIVDESFEGNFSGLDLVERIRQKHLLPYVYILVRSTIERLTEIENALAAGANDCLVIIKLHDLFQIRSKMLVGLKWLDYIDANSGLSNVEIKSAVPLANQVR